MSYEVFLSEVCSRMSSKLGERYCIEKKEVMKNNDTWHTALLIRDKSENIAPMIYMENYYTMYRDGTSLEEILDCVLAIIKKSKRGQIRRIQTELELEKVRNKIVYRLVNKGKNQKRLEHIPSLPFLDLAIIFYVVCGCTEQELESICVDNTLLKRWNLSIRELFTLAEVNTRRMFPEKKDSLEHILMNSMPEESLPQQEKTMDLNVLSNKNGINGATAMLYPKVIHQIAVSYHKNLVIFPCSIHEILYAPYDEYMQVSMLNEMVEDINQTAVDPEEVLSNHIYIYDWLEKRFISS